MVPGLASRSPLQLASSCFDRCLSALNPSSLYGARQCSGITCVSPASARRAVVIFLCQRMVFRRQAVGAECVHCTEAFSLRGSVCVHTGPHSHLCPPLSTHGDPQWAHSTSPASAFLTPAKPQAPGPRHRQWLHLCSFSGR